MALAPFFERIYNAVGGNLSLSRESIRTALENVSVGVRSEESSATNDQWIADLTVNILARLYPRLSITGNGNRPSLLRRLALKINPEVEFSESSSPEHTIVVGGPGDHDGSLIPSAAGWVARLDHSRGRRSGRANPYSSSAAAALACADLFRRVFLRTRTEPDFSFSLIDFDRGSGSEAALPPVNLGKVAFVGVGAVGNAALWTMARHSGLRGTLHLIDPESLTLLNLQRYVLAGFKDIARAKVWLGQQALRDTLISVKTYQKSLEEFAADHEEFKFPTLVISTDTAAGRRSAQALLPRLVVNGWTGNRALGASWHEFSRDAACLACLYHPHGQGVSATDQAARALGLTPERAAQLWVTRQPLSEEDIGSAAKALGVSPEELGPWRGKRLGELYTDVVCGAAPIDLPGVGRVETVPLAHQSALAGALMAAEMVKRTQPRLARVSQAEPLVSWDDVLSPPPTIWRKPRPREAGCICTDKIYQDVYTTKWAQKSKRR